MIHPVIMMAVNKNALIPIIACVVVVAAVAAAGVFVLTNGNDHGYNITIDEGQTISESQLNDLKKHAETENNVTLTYKTAKYTVVFDGKAIQKINSIADLSLTDVDSSSLSTETQTDLGEEPKVIEINYGENKDFGDGTVTVTIPYSVPAGKNADKVAATYVANDGKLEGVPCKITGGNAVLTLSHFSKYAISYPPAERFIDSAELKVLGNLSKDTKITNEDVTILKELVAKGMPATLYPIADANNDGKINNEDVTVLENVVAGKKAVIWHINYHDVDGNGVMDQELVSTTIPVTSTIMTGSANNFMMLYLLNIVEEVKGACYGSSNDTALYGSTYLSNKEDVCAKLASSSTTIPFEDGKAGASNVIREKNVTCLVTDWNRTYIENEAAFEAGKVDVVRISAAASDKDTYTHSISLLGLIFQKGTEADTLLNLYDETFKTIKDATDALTEDQKKKVVASSMTGYLSSKDSDYTAFCEKAGGVFGLEGFDFGGSTSATVADNLGIFKYDFDKIVHIRTALKYDAKEEDIAKQWAQNANAMRMWKHADDGQVIVSGSIPVPCRVAYIAYALYGDSVPTLSKTWADSIHEDFSKLYHTDVDISKTMVLTGYEFAVKFDESLAVTKDGTPIASGDKFSYGTTGLQVKVADGKEKSGYLILLDGTTMDENGNFVVLDNITIRYVDPAILKDLENLANTFADKAKGFYVQNAKANVGSEGLVTVTNMSYKGATSTGSYSPTFVYYDTVEEAKAAYENLAKLVKEKVKADVQSVNTNSYESDGSVDGMTIAITTSRAADTKPEDQRYIGSTLYGVAYKGHYVIDLYNKPGYLGGYGYDKALWEGSKEDLTELKAYLMGEGNNFAKGLAEAFKTIS
jgi:hypothetical protein